MGIRELDAREVVKHCASELIEAIYANEGEERGLGGANWRVLWING